MRYRVDISYLGRDFHGWQRQPNAITVQQCIEDAFLIIFKENVQIVGCGRTDTGVHAKKYTAHFDSKNNYNSESVAKLNSYLPFSISIGQIIPVEDSFHARFDAISRTYQYYISLKKNPFLKDSAWFINSILDIKIMNEATKLLLTTVDFTSFSKLHTDVKTNNCKVLQAEFQIHDDTLIFTITADRFLRNMVRAIVGTLVDVGKNKLNCDDLKIIIESKDRGKASQSAPAEGLFLTDVVYP
jgi:tRNA pseudouridine38-40 synthase